LPNYPRAALYYRVKVKTVFVTLLLLPVMAFAQPPGRLFIHMAGGYEVVVDGTSVGLTSNDIGGRSIDLAAGAHRVLVRSRDGREGSFTTTIIPGSTTDITLSPLGLRKKAASAEAEPGSLHVLCIPQDCTVTLRDKDRLQNDDKVETLDAGRYPLIATRGAQTLRSSVDIPAGMIVTVEANFDTATVRVADTRRRPMHLTVADADDALATLNVPAYWKNAIRSVLPAGVTVVGAWHTAPNGIRASLRVPSDDVGRSLIRSMVRSKAFAGVDVPERPRREANAVLVDFTFYFPDLH
jgi:hypothetical protein